LSKETRPGKRWKEREPKPRILVAVDARETEKRYLQQFKGSGFPTASWFKVMPRGEDSPDRLVKFAQQHLKSGDFTEAWCVFDEDDYREHGTLHRAHQLAKSKVDGKQTFLAVSSPSFEFWLLLHFKTHPADEPLHRNEAMRRLLKHLPGYDKTCLSPNDFQAGISEAVKRARALCETHPPKTYKNPSTGVGYLVDRLLGKADYIPR
jgi:hypothetical protein